MQQYFTENQAIVTWRKMEGSKLAILCKTSIHIVAILPCQRILKKEMNVAFTVGLHLHVEMTWERLDDSFTPSFIHMHPCFELGAVRLYNLIILLPEIILD
jgi:hypothetical protein